MTTIVVDDNCTQAKQFVKYARTLPFTKIKRKAAPKSGNSELYDTLNRAFADMKLMMDGKKKKQTLDELIEELRQEQENELRNSKN